MGRGIWWMLASPLQVPCKGKWDTEGLSPAWQASTLPQAATEIFSWSKPINVCIICMYYYYNRRQINFYRMFFADFSVNSQPIMMKFCRDYFRVTRRLP